MKKCLSGFCLVVCLLPVSLVNAQQCDRVWVKGRVRDTLQPDSFYNLMVVNRSSGKGVFGQPDGSFGVYAKPGDSLAFSVKDYYVVTILVKADSLCQMRCDIPIFHKSTELQEVVIRPLKSLQEIKEERQALAMRETRTVTGLEAFQSPITALYERFSQKEQSKRRVAEMQYVDSKEKVVQELLHLYVAYDLINLSEEEFDNFVVFLALDEDFLKTASDMELITFIKDKFEHYQRMRAKG